MHWSVGAVRVGTPTDDGHLHTSEATVEPCRHLGSSGLPTPGWPWPRWCSFSGTSDGPVPAGDRTTHPQVLTVRSRSRAHAGHGTRGHGAGPGPGGPGRSTGVRDQLRLPARGRRSALVAQSSCLFEIVEGRSTSPPLAMGRSTWPAPPEAGDRARRIGHFSRKAPGPFGCMQPVHPSVGARGPGQDADVRITPSSRTSPTLHRM